MHLRRDALSRAVKRRLDADLSDGTKPTPPCRRGCLPKTFETALVGPLTTRCAYCHCPRCQKGFFPRERSGLSPAVVRMSGSSTAETSFARSSKLLDELAGVRVETKRVERVAERE